MLRVRSQWSAHPINVFWRTVALGAALTLFCWFSFVLFVCWFSFAEAFVFDFFLAIFWFLILWFDCWFLILFEYRITTHFLHTTTQHVSRVGRKFPLAKMLPVRILQTFEKVDRLGCLPTGCTAIVGLNNWCYERVRESLVRQYSERMILTTTFSPRREVTCCPQ